MLTAASNVPINPGSAYSEDDRGERQRRHHAHRERGVIELADIEGGITLNSEILEAFHADTLMNEHMDGELPLLKPGTLSRRGDQPVDTAELAVSDMATERRGGMKVIDMPIATAEVELGYLEKKSNKDPDDKTANAGSSNYM